MGDCKTMPCGWKSIVRESQINTLAVREYPRALEKSLTMASHPSPVEHIAVNFSSDAISQADTKCQGSKCNNIIRAGEKRLYAGNANPNKPGRFVCVACFTRYRSQPTTVRRTVSVQEIRGKRSAN